jgi:hypothetical protein
MTRGCITDDAQTPSTNPIHRIPSREPFRAAHPAVPHLFSDLQRGAAVRGYSLGQRAGSEHHGRALTCGTGHQGKQLSSRAGQTPETCKLRDACGKVR